MAKKKNSDDPVDDLKKRNEDLQDEADVSLPDQGTSEAEQKEADEPEAVQDAEADETAAVSSDKPTVTDPLDEVVIEPDPEPETETEMALDSDDADHFHDQDTPDPDEDTLAEAESHEAPSEDAGEDVTDPELASQDAHDGVSEPEPEPKSTAPEKVTETRVVEKIGAVPFLLGGLIAGGIGYGISEYTGAPVEDPTIELRETISAQAETIATLQAQIEGMEIPDLSGVEAAVSEVSAAASAVGEQVGSVSGALDDLTVRVTELEKRPVTDAVSEEAIAAYERELATLLDEVTRQRAEALEAQAAAETTAQAAEEAAAAAAQTALARDALTRVQLALDTGEPFADAVSDLADNGVADIPDVLTAAAADGVPTVATLQAAFPDVARAALAAVRTGAAEGDGGGVVNFLQNRLAMRSVTPREGDDPDAVLSRVGAAVEAGDLEIALSEIETLPEAAMAALADWHASVSARVGAQGAIDTLATRLSSQ